MVGGKREISFTLDRNKAVNVAATAFASFRMAMHGIPSVTELVELAEGIGRHGGDGFKFWQQGAYLALYS